MPSFTITPVSVESAVGTDFPNFIQFQQDGTDLGLPDADTVNLTGAGVTATRGTGESANVITVDIPGSTTPGGADSLVVSLAPISGAQFEGAIYDDWTGTERVASTDSHWDQTTQTVMFDAAGVYQVSLQASVRTESSLVDWPATGASDSVTLYGSVVPEALGMQTSEYGRKPADPLTIAADPRRAQWHDNFIVDATALPASFTPQVYASNYLDGGAVAVFAALLSVQRLGDAVA